MKTKFKVGDKVWSYSKSSDDIVIVFETILTKVPNYFGGPYYLKNVDKPCYEQRIYKSKTDCVNDAILFCEALLEVSTSALTNTAARYPDLVPGISAYIQRLNLNVIDLNSLLS